MEIFVLIAIQLAVTVGGLALIWRRLDGVSADMRALRVALDALETRFGAATYRRAQAAAPAPAREQRAEPVLTAALVPPADASFEPPAPPPPEDVGGSLSNDPFDDAWVRPDRRKLSPARADGAPTPRLRPIEDVEATPRWRPTAPQIKPAPTLSPDTARAVVAVATLCAPLIGLGFAAPLAAVVASGLVISAALLLVAMRPSWTHTAWFAALGGGAWAAAGLFGIGQALPAAYCAALLIAGAAGVGYARAHRPSAPGVALALFIAAASLTLGAQIGMIGPAGAVFALVIALAAVAGATAQRLEPIHVAALAAAGLGLFVLSGQDSAAVWFTPAASWAGALFFSLMAIRTPMLGARGAMLAATGTVAPIFAASTLVSAVHGLETPLAGAGAFAGLAVLFAGVLALLIRRAEDVEDVRFAAWILTAAALGSAATAIYLASPAPMAAACLAALVLGFAWVDRLIPNMLWRAAAIVAASACLYAAAQSAVIVASVGHPGPALIAAVFGIAAPALFAGLAALVFARNRARITAAILETLAIAGGVAALSAGARLAFSNGAPALAPVGFVELGAHAALWLAAALALALRVTRGARPVRKTAIDALAVAAIGACLVGATFWLTPALAPRLYQPEWAHPPLGFVAPAVLAWAHWAFWRRAGVRNRARLAFAASALLTAAWAVLELAWFRSSGTSDWVTVSLSAAAFAIAAGVNFIPGLAAPRTAPAR